MSVTIKDIAKSLGVSYSTVSRALNNKPGVSKKTRERIIEQAKKMGYQPNDMARGLVKKRTKTIGVVIPDIANSFFGEVTQGIIDTANENGYTILLCISNWDFDIEKKHLKTLLEKRVDGIILKPAKDDVDEKYFSKINVPFILLEGWQGDKSCSYVKVDNEKGGYMATKYLIERGYQNIAYAGGKKEAHSNLERVEGYIKALKEHGRKVERELIRHNDFTVSGGYKLAEELLNSHNKVDAIFAGNDVIALGILHYAATHGYKVPDQLGVIGFDDIFYAEFHQIQLTTIRQPKYLLGKNTLELLLQEIRDDEDRVNKAMILEPKLIVRKTTR
ncbi:MAG: LacI family transcriptional regulator [Tissierellia bacterium]|nr:LacI family transcriptional regulator [Tissierellia bacterium]